MPVGGLAGFNRLHARYSLAMVSFYGEFPKVNPGNSEDSPVGHLAWLPKCERTLALIGPAPQAEYPQLWVNLHRDLGNVIQSFTHGSSGPT